MIGRGRPLKGNRFGNFRGMTDRQKWKLIKMSNESSLYAEVNELLKRWEREISIESDINKRLAIRHCSMQLQGVLSGEKARDV
jgi:hypothetical protein